MPFSYNPFSREKADFLKNVKVPPELPPKKPLQGVEDDRQIQQSNVEPSGKSSVTERVVVKEKEAPEPDFLP